MPSNNNLQSPMVELILKNKWKIIYHTFKKMAIMNEIVNGVSKHKIKAKTIQLQTDTNANNDTPNLEQISKRRTPG